MTFGEKLTLALKYRNLKQKDLAKKINVTEVSVCRWCGDIRIPKISDVKKICKAINVSADWLLDL